MEDKLAIPIIKPDNTNVITNKIIPHFKYLCLFTCDLEKSLNPVKKFANAINKTKPNTI